MTLLKRQASQELLPTRAPKLARGQDTSASSGLARGFIATAVKFLHSNVSAFYEGTCLLRLPLTRVMRSRFSCNRGRDTQTIPPAQANQPTAPYASQTSASGHSETVQNTATPLRRTITSAIFYSLTRSQARNNSIITSRSPSTLQKTRAYGYIIF